MQSTLEKKGVRDLRSSTTCQSSRLKAYNGSMDEPERHLDFINIANSTQIQSETIANWTQKRDTGWFSTGNYNKTYFDGLKRIWNFFFLLFNKKHKLKLWLVQTTLTFKTEKLKCGIKPYLNKVVEYFAFLF